MDHRVDLVGRLHRAKNLIHGCESLSVASTDGLVLATTHEEARQGEFLAAVTSMLLTSCARGLTPFKAGECNALDYRGDRQVLMVRLDGMRAYLVAILHPGAHPVNCDEPSLRQALCDLPSLLHGEDTGRQVRWMLARDKTCRLPLRHGKFLVGRAAHCDLVLADPRVNAEHVLFENVQGNLQVTDLDTENGTKLNGRAFTGTVPLACGDRLQFPRAGGLTVCALDPEGRELGLDGEEAVATGSSSGRRKRKKSGSRS